MSTASGSKPLAVMLLKGISLEAVPSSLVIVSEAPERSSSVS